MEIIDLIFRPNLSMCGYGLNQNKAEREFQINMED